MENSVDSIRTNTEMQIVQLMEVEFEFIKIRKKSSHSGVVKQLNDRELMSKQGCLGSKLLLPWLMLPS